MKNKEIIVSEAILDRSNISDLSPICMQGLRDFHGYNIIVINDRVYVDLDWFDNDGSNTRALINDRKFKNVSVENTTSIIFDISGINPQPIPEFGVSIDDNYNIQQTNILIQDAQNDEALNEIIITDKRGFHFWDINQNLHIGGSVYSKETFEQHIEAVRNQGYSNPLVLYVDKEYIRIYFYNISAYLYSFLNFNILPIRVISYIDIKYVEKISSTIYAAIRSIERNPYYYPRDDKDYSEFMVSNFSDKREIIKSLTNNAPSSPNGTIFPLNINNLVEILPFFFTEPLDYLNHEFLDKLIKHKYQDTYVFDKETGHFADNMSINTSLFNYMNGYALCKYNSYHIEDLDPERLEVIREIPFDPAIYLFDTFDYLDYGTNSIRRFEEKVFEKFECLVVDEKYQNIIISMNRIHRFIKKWDLKIKIVRQGK